MLTINIEEGRPERDPQEPERLDLILNAFVFTHHGQPFGPRARTLKEFVTMQQRLPAAALKGHAQRGDFSRWVVDVFGDQPLAAAIRKIEKRRGGGGHTYRRE